MPWFFLLSIGLSEQKGLPNPRSHMFHGLYLGLEANKKNEVHYSWTHVNIQSTQKSMATDILIDCCGVVPNVPQCCCFRPSLVLRSCVATSFRLSSNENRADRADMVAICRWDVGQHCWVRLGLGCWETPFALLFVVHEASGRWNTNNYTLLSLLQINIVVKNLLFVHHVIMFLQKPLVYPLVI